MMLTTRKIYTVGADSHFVPDKIFNCGQCFRFERCSDGSYEGVAFSKYLRAEKDKNGKILLYGADKGDYDSVWRSFLDMDTDYKALSDAFSAMGGVMKEAAEIGKGIRILRQDPWEALCSFIISQNNNIPRIKKIIENLSRSYGEKIYSPDGREFYSFPTAKRLFEAGEEEIFSYKTGFRAKYIYDAAKKVTLGDIDLDAVYAMNTADASEYLKQIKGVGDKVAACVLLFAYHKTDSFPVDVWVKKILAKYFDGKIPDFGQYAGIAQQYLFYYERYVVNGIKI
ncbi:MAG: DNA-3-methyladenine glycosylase 2 family protein [Ruminococcaceae bacterium]|nr:DNA-3-methyladenine glycosylase 2 family protein [Oscillospiraceae bacterium]